VLKQPLLPYLPEKRPNMRQLAIVPRLGHEVGTELHASILCLRSAGIHAHNAVIGPACALIWVDDQKTLTAVEALRTAGFQATALTETDVPN
jgi:hypothetical protein